MIRLVSILTNSSIIVSAGENAMTFQILEERISKLEEAYAQYNYDGYILKFQFIYY